MTTWSNVHCSTWPPSIHAPGLTLVYAPGSPRYGNLIMSHSEVGVGTDDFGDDYQDGDTAYRAAFIRATPSGRMGRAIPNVNSGISPPQSDTHTTSRQRDQPDSDGCLSRSASSSRGARTLVRSRCCGIFPYGFKGAPAAQHGRRGRKPADLAAGRRPWAWSDDEPVPVGAPGARVQPPVA
jgi:hypothetical protein